MNHDAKYTGGIFRRRPSSASTSSRLSIQSGRSGSVSCPTSPRHSKHLPAITSISNSSANLNDVFTATTSNYYDGPRHLHRSPSNPWQTNYRQSSSVSYTGLCANIIGNKLISAVGKTHGIFIDFFCRYFNNIIVDIFVFLLLNRYVFAREI